MTDQQENAAFDAKAHLEELLSNMRRLENELGVAKAEARIFSSDRDSLRRQLDHAQGAAMEMRGRLLAAHADQTVRRGDVEPTKLPNVYGGWDEVPF